MSHFNDLSTVIRGTLYRVGLDRRLGVSRWFALWVSDRTEVLVWHVDPLTFKLAQERRSRY